MLSLGTFSKILAPGLRLGWIQTTPELMQPLLASGALVSGGNFNHFTSHVVRQLMESGELAAFVAGLRASYAERAQAMDAALRKHLSGIARWQKPAGGYFFWLELPEGADAAALEAAARAAGTGFLPGTFCSIVGRPAALPAAFLRALHRARDPRGHRAPRSAPSSNEADPVVGRQPAAAAGCDCDEPQRHPAGRAAAQGASHEAPTDVPAIRMLAEVAVRVRPRRGRRTACSSAASSSRRASRPRATTTPSLLHRRNDPERALAEVERLLAREPAQSGLSQPLRRAPEPRRRIRTLERGSTRAARGVPAQCQGLAELRPRAEDRGPAGRKHRRLPAQHRARSRLRRGVLEPREPQDFPLRRRRTSRRCAARLARPDGRRRRTACTSHFALGKALRGRGRLCGVVRALCEGQCAAPRAQSIRRGPEHGARPRSRARSSRASSSRARAGSGCPAPDPIFIVGMPRAGSTLLEQILSSHSAVEGTTELPEIITMAAELRGQRGRRTTSAPTPTSSPRMGAARLCASSASAIIERTRIHRKTDRPFFIDKMPNNFLHVGDDPPGAAEREDHRRPPASAGLLLLELQAALRPRPALQLSPRGPGPLLPRLRRADGALRCGPARPHPPGLLRAHRRGHRGGGAPAARLLRPAVRAGMPALLRERAPGADRELRAGSPADLPRRHRPVAALRALARPAEGRARAGARRLSGRPAGPDRRRCVPRHGCNCRFCVGSGFGRSLCRNWTPTGE